MGNFSELIMNEAISLNSFTKVLRVEKGVIYLFHENNIITNCCFVEIEDNFFKITKLMNLTNLKLGDTQEINNFIKVLRVEKGVIYLFSVKSNVTNSCFIEMDDNLFIETRTVNRIELR